MRTINKKPNNGGEVVAAAHVIKPTDDLADRQPCWYAKYEEVDGRCVWRVGVRDQSKDDEIEFMIDPDNTKFRSLDFVTKVIDIFKKGRHKAVERWVSDGCP